MFNYPAEFETTKVNGFPHLVPLCWLGDMKGCHHVKQDASLSQGPPRDA